MTTLLTLTDRGLHCPQGDFFIDPWRAVNRAVITHGHGDHARWGSESYLAVDRGGPILRERLGPGANLHLVPYGRAVDINGVQISLHPAGHILGSAQVRLEHRGEVCVVSGDYKTGPDPTCEPIEPLRCQTFVSESTFGLPIYRWPPSGEIFDQINRWWQSNQACGRTSVIFAYALGKAQRVLAGIDPTIGPIFVHGAVARFISAYKAVGVRLPPVQHAGAQTNKAGRGRALVVAPPSAAGSPWMRKFGPVSIAMASGWMQVRGARRRRAMDRGFVLSDHADWDGLLETIRQTGASEVWVTHGYTSVVTRWLSEHGIAARALATRFEGETESIEPDENAALEPEDGDGQSIAKD